MMTMKQQRAVSPVFQKRGTIGALMLLVMLQPALGNYAEELERRFQRHLDEVALRSQRPNRRRLPVTPEGSDSDASDYSDGSSGGSPVPSPFHKRDAAKVYRTEDDIVRAMQAIGTHGIPLDQAGLKSVKIGGLLTGTENKKYTKTDFSRFDFVRKQVSSSQEILGRVAYAFNKKLLIVWQFYKPEVCDPIKQRLRKVKKDNWILKSIPEDLKKTSLYNWCKSNKKMINEIWKGELRRHFVTARGYDDRYGRIVEVFDGDNVAVLWSGNKKANPITHFTMKHLKLTRKPKKIPAALSDKNIDVVLGRESSQKMIEEIRKIMANYGASS